MTSLLVIYRFILQIQKTISEVFRSLSPSSSASSSSFPVVVADFILPTGLYNFKQ